MDSQTPIGVDWLRTYWTPTMECYFIDLMLDHIHRGNRVGHTFTKQAWADMLAVFSTKFGYQHDKDILKNIYSSLWKQFNEVKNLLDQSGFSWDDTQQLVVADSHVWDTFVKARPDAQYYRNKPLMNFNDLCLIYAYTTADGRYSRSSHDIDFDDEIQGVNIVEGKEEQTTTVSNCTRTYWSLPMDHYLIGLLLDQVLRGNKIGHAFITQAWNEMAKSFNSKFGPQYDKDVLKNRYKHLRQQYKDVKILLNHSGFSWDESRQMVTAADYIWDSYTKVFPDAQLYKFKTIPGYRNLCVICGDEDTNGRPGRTAHNEDLNESDYSMTDWTPSMDRYLIDLLLKQMHKGHKINHIFNKQAWIDIVASFNDVFGSRHDKCVLEGQYKNLRKLYNDVKNLIDLDEFCWDESLQMVTAPHDVWDVYTKEHPDEKSFITKKMPNYNDLCMIYGNLTSKGRWSQSAQDVGFNGDGWDFRAFENGGCPSFYWTPPMDRYFIDLMLEQIRKGNMVDQSFKKQAWRDMVEKFIAKFGSQNHKDVLKSRFENLRNLFIDMRTLIGRSGFAWDEMQQMITASGDTWDAYIKEHPDAQSYRSRALPSYNDLFLIYGNASTNGHLNHANYCTNLDDDAPGVNIGQEDDQSSADSDTRSIAWTKAMDRYFIDLMLEQVLEGNKVDHMFNKQAWVSMITSFNKKFGLQLDKYVLENRYLSLMEHYEDISTLLNQNGFTWDEIQQKVIADDDVWEAYLEEHPNSALYKGETLESYNDLSVIFTNGIQDGRSSYPFPEMGIDGNGLEMGMDGIFGALQSVIGDIEVSNPRKRRQSATPLTSARGRKIKRTRKQSQEVGGSNTLDKNCSSIESIVDALQAVPDMDDELFLDACDLLEEEKKAKAFVKMDIPHRKKWLLRNLRA